MKKVVFVVGHTVKKKGSLNYKGEHEYDFNLRILHHVNRLVPGSTILIKDNPDYLKEIAAIRPDIILELHFNSALGDARGCEILVLDGNKKAEQLGKIFCKLFAAYYGIKNRGVKLLLPGDRGHINLVNYVPYCKLPFIFEPCFGNNKTSESEQIFENEIKYAEELAFLVGRLSEEFI